MCREFVANRANRIKTANQKITTGKLSEVDNERNTQCPPNLVLTGPERQRLRQSRSTAVRFARSKHLTVGGCDMSNDSEHDFHDQQRRDRMKDLVSNVQTSQTKRETFRLVLGEVVRFIIVLALLGGLGFVMSTIESIGR